MNRSMTILFAALLATPLFAGCIDGANDLVAANLKARPPTITLDDEGFAPKLVEGYLYSTFSTMSSAGFPVTAEVYLPDVSTALPNASVPETFPTILLASPYNGAGYGKDIEFGYGPYDFLIERMLPRGYAIVIGDSAAMGGSGGCWDFMGPDDVASVLALVEGITSQEWSDGKVGMMGLSYDGMTQIMAASHNAPGLVTVVPAAPLTHAYAGLYMGGVHYGGGWMSTTASYTLDGLTPPGTNAERYPGFVDSARRAPPCAAETTVYGNDPSGAYNAWYQARDFRPFSSTVAPSVFYIQGFLDGAVKPDNYDGWFENVPGPKKAWLGHWYHQYPTAQNAGRADMYLTLNRWFDHWLKGADNGIDQELHVDVQDSRGDWRTEDKWPPTRGAAPTTLHIASSGALQAEPGEDGAIAFGGPLSTAATVTEQAPGAPLEVIGEPLATDLRIAGSPRLNLTLASSAPGGQVIAQLYDTDGASSRLISRGAFNLLLAEDATAAKPLSRGVPVTIDFALYPTDYVVPAGHTLRLVLDTSDAPGWWNPDPWGATLTLSTGATSPAALTLPTIERGADDIMFNACGRPLDIEGLDCYDEDLKDDGVGA